MTIRELMVEVEQEIEAAKRSGAWEFDYHAEMEEIEELLNAEACKVGVEAQVEIFEATKLAVEAPEVVEPTVVVAEAVEVVPGTRADFDLVSVEKKDGLEEVDSFDATFPAYLLSEKQKDLLFVLMKGVRKATADKAQAMYRDIISLRPVAFKHWRAIRKRHFPTLEDTRYVILKFKKVGAIEWDGDLMHDVAWL